MSQHFFGARKSIRFAGLIILIAGSISQGRAEPSDPNKSTPAKHATMERNGFTSGSRHIRAEWFYAANAKERPVIILLHGSGGLGSGTGGFFRDLGAALSKKGYNAVIVRYMDQQKIDYATSSQMGKYFVPWLKTIHDAIDYVASNKSVDGKNVVLMGHSLGAQLALHEASSDPRVGSVVDMAGCFVLATSKITRMPPVLVLQGEADRVVTLNREKAMVTVLKRIQSPYEEHFYKKADHALSNVSFEELVNTTAAFLKKQE